MNKKQTNGTGAEEAGRATGAAVATARNQYRFCAGRKGQAVLRLLGGEQLETLSRELGVPGHELSQWRERFLASGQAAMKQHQPDVRDEQLIRLKTKIGDLTMDNELLQERLRRTEEPPFGGRRSRS